LNKLIINTTFREDVFGIPRIPTELRFWQSIPLSIINQFNFIEFTLLTFSKLEFAFYIPKKVWAGFEQKLAPDNTSRSIGEDSPSVEKWRNESLEELNLSQIEPYLFHFYSGFKKGYSEFKQSCISGDLYRMHKKDIINNIFAFINSYEGGIPSLFVTEDVSNIDQNLWYNAGFDAGLYYTSWIVILNSPIPFVTLFEKVNQKDNPQGNVFSIDPESVPEHKTWEDSEIIFIIPELREADFTGTIRIDTPITGEEQISATDRTLEIKDEKSINAFNSNNDRPLGKNEIIMEYLKYFSGKSEFGDEIMPKNDYNYVLKKTIEFVTYNDFDIEAVNPIPKSSRLSWIFIRYTYYLLYKRLCGKNGIDVWINFVHKLFGSYTDANIITTKKQFSQYKNRPSPSYEEDKNLIRLI
jgi:hypothetical protein